MVSGVESRKQLAIADQSFHIICLCVFQMFPILSSTPAKDWSAVSLKSELGTGPIYRELAAQLEAFQDELSNIAETGQKHECKKHRFYVTICDSQ